MDEIIFGSTCDICAQEMPAKVGVKSFRIKAYGSKVEEVCGECKSPVVEDVRGFNVSCCEVCKDKVLYFINDLVNTRGGKDND